MDVRYTVFVRGIEETEVYWTTVDNISSLLNVSTLDSIFRKTSTVYSRNDDVDGCLNR